MSIEAAFGPRSLTAGAILPRAGRDLMIEHGGAPPGIAGMTEDGWLAPEVAVLVRDEARILPLAWWGAPRRAYNPLADVGELAAFAPRMRSAGLHRAGNGTRMDLSADRSDSIGSYIAALRVSGATCVDAWVYVEDEVGMALVLAGDEGAGDRSLAVHVVPAEWVFERGVAAAVDGIDVSWSWSDVIALHRDRVVGSAAHGHLAHRPVRSMQEVEPWG